MEKERSSLLSLQIPWYNQGEAAPLEPPWAQLGQGCAAELHFPEHAGAEPAAGLHMNSSS